MAYILKQLQKLRFGRAKDRYDIPHNGLYKQPPMGTLVQSKSQLLKVFGYICSIGLLTGIILYSLYSNSNRRDQTRYSQLSINGAYFVPTEIIDFQAEIPCIAITIEDKTAPVKIDLGSDTAFILPKEFLQRLEHKSFVRRDFFYGLRGKKHESDVYSIPKIRIGGMTVFDSKAKELNIEFEKDATLLNPDGSSLAPMGAIGWTLFHNFNFFLDCKNSLFAFCDSLETLKKKGYPVSAFVETPLLLDQGLIEFEAMTDSGPMRCLLDTGCTINMLNKDLEGKNDHMIFNQMTIETHDVVNPENADLMIFDPKNEYTVSMFKIGNKDFGDITFTKLKTPINIDAILGMEFINSKLIFIDFPHRKIYFGEHQH